MLYELGVVVFVIGNRKEKYCVREKKDAWFKIEPSQDKSSHIEKSASRDEYCRQADRTSERENLHVMT